MDSAYAERLVSLGRLVNAAWGDFFVVRIPFSGNACRSLEACERR
jgi:hypothetical protein